MVELILPIRSSFFHRRTSLGRPGNAEVAREAMLNPPYIIGIKTKPPRRWCHTTTSENLSRVITNQILRNKKVTKASKLRNLRFKGKTF